MFHIGRVSVRYDSMRNKQNLVSNCMVSYHGQTARLTINIVAIKNTYCN